MTARDEVVRAAQQLLEETGRNEFAIAEIVERAIENGSLHARSTLQTQVTSRCCKDAPKNHGVTYQDFETVRRGVYRLVKPPKQSNQGADRTWLTIQSLGWTREEAARIRAKFSSIAADWDDPSMDVYDEPPAR
jgi:hypothetical protein